MATIGELPFDARRGYPQVRETVIRGTVYRLEYRWNVRGFATLTITDISSGEIVFNGKLTLRYCFEAKDSTGTVRFGVMAWEITEKTATVWVIHV